MKSWWFPFLLVVILASVAAFTGWIMTHWPTVQGPTG